MRSVHSLVLSFVMALTAMLILATPSQGDNSDASSEELKALRRRIAEQRARTSELVAVEKSQLERLNILEQEQALVRELLEGLEAREITVMDEVRVLEAEIGEGQARVVARRERLAAHLRDMYMHKRPSPLEVVLTAGNVNQIALVMNARRHVVRTEQKLIEEVLADQRGVRDRQIGVSERLAEVHAMQSEARDEQARLTGLRGDREGALGDIRKEREIFEASLTELQEAARRMEDLLNDLERKRVATAPIPGAPQFSLARGVLPWPVDGPVIKPFGRSVHPEFKTVVLNKGINIGAAMGTPIRAVGPGSVDYVNWLPGYGKCIIVNHGSGYYTLYAHASEVFSQEGAVVSKGDVIGEVGDTGSLNGSQLYFEVRKGKEPLDPLQWLASSQSR